MNRRHQSRLRALAAQLRGFVFGPPADAEVDHEIEEHLRLLTERFVAQGLPRDEAAMAARRRFGNITMLQEDRRALQTLPSIETLWYDLRYALRALWRSPAFSAVSIATMGLGIGAATAIFSVIYNVLLAPFPYPDAGRMVFPRIYSLQQGRDSGRQGYRAAEAREIIEQNHVFDATTAAFGELVLYTYAGGADQLNGARVTPGTFEFFGMPALHGRVLQQADHAPGAPPAFVLGYKAWREHFGGDLSILNRTFVLNGTPRTLVGIMPPRFGWYGADMYTPEQLAQAAAEADALPLPNWFLLGHLKPGISIDQAEADLNVIAHRLAKIHPDAFPQSFGVHVGTIGDSVVARLRPTLYTVLAAVGLLLLIACSNVANLMLARATAREKEFALRAVLGAGRARLIRLLIVESLVLAMAGAGLGILLAWSGLQAIVAVMPQDLIPSESVIQLNAPVLTATLAIAALTALIFGLMPALQASRRDLTDPLRESGKGVSGGFRGRRVRDAVVVMEVALSLTLLIGAGLLMRSFVALREVHLGLQPDHVFQVVTQLPDRYKTAAQTTGALQPLLARLRALPGVEHAAASTALPPYSASETNIEVVGTALGQERQAFLQQVTEAYFRVLRLAFKQGRPFSEADIDDARKVAVVNETFVRRYLSNGQALGRRVRLVNLETAAEPVPDAWFEIVGVVGDVMNRGLTNPSAPEVWIPSTIAASSVQVLMVRTSQDPATVANAVRRAVLDTDASVAMALPRTLEQWISERLYAGPRFGFLLMTIFGGVGLMLVTVGVYSVLAYSTTRMTHEIGVRMALGAEGTDVLGMVVRGGLRLVAVGIAIGVAMSLGLARFMVPQLVGVRTYDALTLSAATLVLTATAAIACWIPARRAARIDPMIALHYE